MEAALDMRITYIGRTNHRNADTLFGIRQRDRRSHMYVLGKTGTGKSHLLRIMLAQGLHANEGCALFDPHGEIVLDLLSLVPGNRSQDVIFLNLPDPTLDLCFNPLTGVPSDKRSLAVAGIIEVFKKLWPDDWGPRLEHVFRNVIFTLLETAGSTLADVPRLLTDKEYRADVTSTLENETVRDFWRNEYDRYSLPFRAVVIAPLQNKLGALLTDPLLRRVLTQEGTSLNLRRIMDEGKILLVNLDKGRIGEGPAALLGSLLLSHIALAGISRSELPETRRRDFFVYLDEFQTFTTLSLANMLSELRKYCVGMVLANQHLAQLEREIREAVFGNVGTLVSFRVGASDASYIARELAPVFSENDLIGLPRYHAYVRLLIDGETSRPFSATTIGSLDELPRWNEHFAA